METQQGVVTTRDVLAPYRKLLFAHFERHDMIPKVEHCDYLDVITNEGKTMVIPDFRNSQLHTSFAMQTSDNWPRRKPVGYYANDPIEHLILADLHSAVQKTGFVAWVKNRYHPGSHNHSPYVPFATCSEAIQWVIRWGRSKSEAATFLQNYMLDVLGSAEDDAIGEFFYALVASQFSDTNIELSSETGTVLRSVVRRTNMLPLMAADSEELGKALLEVSGKVLGSCHYNENNT